MKKLLALLCAVMLICAPLVACAGGDTEQDESGGITAPGTDTDTDGGDQDPPAVTQEPIVYDDALETEIEELYKEVDEASDGVLYSFGVYGGYTAVVELDSYLASDMKVFNAAGKQFVFPTCAEIRAYNGGKLYTVAQAYENGFLSGEDVADIYRRFNRLNYGCEEGFDPSAIDTIKNAYAENHNTTADNVFVDIRGVYGDAYALWVNERGSGSAQVLTHEVVANVLFVYGSSWSPEVYCDGDFYSLSEAYKQGLLSRNDVIDLRKHYSLYWIFSRLSIDSLTDEVAVKVCEYMEDKYNTYVDPEDISLEIYAVLGNGRYDVFGGEPAYVMFVNGPWDTGATPHTDTIGGVEFQYSDGFSLLYYSDSRFHSLEEMYENGMSVETLAMINYYYKNRIISVV